MNKGGIRQCIGIFFVLIISAFVLATLHKNVWSDTGTRRAISPQKLREELSLMYALNKEYMGPKDECEASKVQKAREEGGVAWNLKKANCGLGYEFNNSTGKHHRWTVALFGFGFNSVVLGLSGCPLGKGKCPLSPRCEIIQTARMEVAASANVAVMFQNDYSRVYELPKRKKEDPATILRKYRVLYWREAYLTVPKMDSQQLFDLQMGVHWHSGILNPQFLRTPSALLGGMNYPKTNNIPFIPPEERKHFAMSIISVCHTKSRRAQYIDQLVAHLGKAKVHQYGACGNLALPPPPLKNAARTISHYKFYLSFENTIQDGYVSEKLLQVLSMPIIPIYLGTPNTPNITITPSYIKVSDFPNPKRLADYLLFLDENHDEYMKYHEWRRDPNLFHPDYLDLLAKKAPGVDELEPYRKKHMPHYPRAAACCRLCDANYLHWAMENRKHIIEPTWNSARIQKTLFNKHPNSVNKYTTTGSDDDDDTKKNLDNKSNNNNNNDDDHVTNDNEENGN